MSQYTSYYLYQKFEKRGDQDWLPAYPNVFSADGDGTMSPVIKQDDDPGCGYVPAELYRWVNLDITTDYYCLECGSNEYKLSGFYGASGTPFSVNCDSATTLTSADTSAYSGITYARVGYCITEIGDRAFMARGSLSGVSMPSTITSIGASAFTNSQSLIECVIPQSVTSIGAYAFKDCTSLQNVILWDSITSIGTSAFENCDYLIGVNIPTGLTGIPSSCFSDCGALSNVVIPLGITSIGYRSFYKCIGLISIDIPSGVTTIGESAFEGCSGLTSVTVNATTPPTLSGYRNWFSDTNNCPIYVPCDSLLNYISASGWSNYASRIHGIPPCETPKRFVATYSDSSKYTTYCASSSSTTLTSGNTRPSGYAYTAMTSAEVGNCITEIDRAVFSGFTNLSACTIGTGITSIGNSAFTSCYDLTSITIPNSVTSIGDNVFYNCTNLRSVNIPSGVTSIGKYTFQSCRSLTSIDIPNGVTSIGLGAFRYCSGLTSMDIPSGVTSIGRYAFNRCTSLTSCAIGSGVTSIGDYAFSACSSLTSVTILATTPPSNINNAFGYFPDREFYVPCDSVLAYRAAISSNIGNVYGIPPCETPKKLTATYSSGITTYECVSPSDTISVNSYDRSGMTSAVIGDCVTSIDRSGFSGCTSLTSVTIPNSVREIGVYAFYRCTGLTSVNIPDSVTAIYTEAFAVCINLASVTIGSGITQIADYAFADCTGITGVTVNATTPPTLGTYVFGASWTPENYPIYVPVGSVDTYKAASGWNNYASRIRAIGS